MSPRRSMLSCAVILAFLVSAGLAPPAHARGGGSGGPRLDGFERVVLRLVNDRRAAYGLRRVRPSRRLSRAADAHSRDMVRRDYFAHDTLGGPSWHARIARIAGFRRTGEILAYVGRHRDNRARTAVSLWMQSPGHRAVLLSRRFTHAGIGARSGNLAGRSRTVFTVDFARRR